MTLPTVLVAALIATGAAAQRSRVEDGAPPLADRLDAAVRALAEPGFVGAVLVARGGRVILRAGYGAADRGSTPATPRTLFDIASVAKQFTAAAILKLEADGELTTRDTLDRFFDDLPEDKAAIRLHDLLTHTSGLSTDLAIDADELAERDRWLARIWASPLVSPPGERFVYSNIGYGVLAAVVERAARRPFEAYCKRKLFAPAGLDDTGFVQDLDLDRSRAAARWQRRGDGANRETAIVWPWHWNFRGATGVVTTVDNLYAWDRALLGDRVLPQIQRDKLLRPRLAGYAYGWEIARTPRGTTEQAHRGVTVGFESWCARYPDEDAFICVLGNHECRIGDLSDELERVLFAAGAPDEVLERAVGSWHTTDGERLEVRAENGGLVVRGFGGELAARVAYGTGRSSRNRFGTAAFARHAARTVEDALRRRRKSTFSPAATDTAVDAARTAARDLGRAHGGVRQVLVLCSGRGAAETWLQVRFGTTDTLWRARWAEDRGLLELAPAEGSPPVPTVDLVWRRGGTFVGRSEDGRLRVSLTVPADRESASWRDEDAGRQPITLGRGR